MTTPSVTEDQIRETAYLFWLEDGQPNGRDQEHWLKAVIALSAPSAAKAPTLKSPTKRATPKSAAKAAPAAAKKQRAPKAAAKSAAKPKTV